MDFLKNLGFDPIMLGAQILNFLIIFYLLKRFLYKPVLDMIKKREDIIKEGLSDAEKSKIALEKALEEEKKILIKAQDNAKKIIDDSKIQALEIQKNIKENTKIQSEKILKDATDRIIEETKEAEKKLAGQVSQLAGEIVKKSLTEMIGQKEQKDFIEKAVKKINK